MPEILTSWNIRSVSAFRSGKFSEHRESEELIETGEEELSEELSEQREAEELKWAGEDELSEELSESEDYSE